MPILQDNIPKPISLNSMMTISRYLTKSLDFVRVDLYCIKEKVFVGELTITPVGGTGIFTPQEWDRKLGDLWIL